MNKNLEVEKAFDSMWYEVEEDIERGEHVDGQWIKDILELKGFTLVKNSDLKKSRDSLEKTKNVLEEVRKISKYTDMGQPVKWWKDNMWAIRTATGICLKDLYESKV